MLSTPINAPLPAGDSLPVTPPNRPLAHVAPSNLGSSSEDMSYSYTTTDYVKALQKENIELATSVEELMAENKLFRRALAMAQGQNKPITADKQVQEMIAEYQEREEKLKEHVKELEEKVQQMEKEKEHLMKEAIEHKVKKWMNAVAEVASGK